MKPNVVSIIMPAYNGERFIEQAIQSVLAQTYPYWELVIVDDGSTDATAHIVTSFGDPRMRYVRQANRGQAAALNYGLSLAQGAYITTLDVDDWLTPTSVSDRVAFLEQHLGYGAVYGNGYYCNVKGEVLRHFSDNWGRKAVGDVYDILINTSFFGTGANVLVRREVFVQHEIAYDESIFWCQDWDLYCRIAEHVHFGLVETYTVWYRLHEDNMTLSSPTGRRLDSKIRTKFKLLSSPRFQKVAADAKVLFFQSLLVHELCGRLDDQERVIKHPCFQMLNQSQQASILRLAAINYLLRGEHLEPARQLLRSAQVLAPYDVKTATVAFLFRLNSHLAGAVVKGWRHLSGRNQPSTSVLDLARG